LEVIFLLRLRHQRLGGLYQDHILLLRPLSGRGGTATLKS